jgi:hypothetical protein
MDPPQPQAPILLTALLACALQIVWLRVESSLRKAQSMSMLSMSTIQQPEKHRKTKVQTKVTQQATNPCKHLSIHTGAQSRLQSTQQGVQFEGTVIHTPSPTDDRSKYA